jgi:hypothetical protein
MRLSYVKEEDLTSEADKAVLERVKQRRGEKGLIALDRTLLHSPPVADGWSVKISQSFPVIGPSSKEFLEHRHQLLKFLGLPKLCGPHKEPYAYGPYFMYPF